MTYINPLIAPIAAGSPVQRAAAADKEQQVARAQALSKNSAADGDRFVHQVESSEEIKPVGDDSASSGGQQRQQHSHHSPKHDSDGANPTDDEPRLDVTG